MDKLSINNNHTVLNLIYLTIAFFFKKYTNYGEIIEMRAFRVQHTQF